MLRVSGNQVEKWGRCYIMSSSTIMGTHNYGDCPPPIEDTPIGDRPAKVIMMVGTVPLRLAAGHNAGRLILYSVRHSSLQSSTVKYEIISLVVSTGSQLAFHDGSHFLQARGDIAFGRTAHVVNLPHKTVLVPPNMMFICRKSLNFQNPYPLVLDNLNQRCNLLHRHKPCNLRLCCSCN